MRSIPLLTIPLHTCRTPSKTRAIAKKSEKTLHRDFSEYFARSGGFHSVIQSPPINQLAESVRASVRGINTAGFVLKFMYDAVADKRAHLAGGPSINKALHVLTAVSGAAKTKGAEFYVPNNEKYMRDAWAKYRCVAHFCAAFRYMVSDLIDSAPCWLNESIPRISEIALAIHMYGLTEFVGIARTYQDFGLSHVAPRSEGQTLLRPDEIIRLPDGIPGIPVAPEPLSDTIIDALRQYRAPKRI